MLNQEMRTVTMNRSDMLRVAQALTHVVLEFRDEVRTATTEDRRRSAIRPSARSRITTLMESHATQFLLVLRLSSFRIVIPGDPA